MASIKLVLASTAEDFQVNDVNMESVTNTELLNEAVANGVFPPAGADMTYALVGKDGKPIAAETTKTLAEIGYKDGDNIKVLSVAKGA